MKAASRTLLRTDPVEALRQDIAAIRRDMAAIVANRAGAVGDSVKAHLNGATSQARYVAEQAKHAAGAAHERLRDATGARPLTTIAVSATAGIVGIKLLSWMLRRAS
jgi:ElaB/YqjD/DUF883 family membrane-anchored ribosome-binding protein